MKKVLTYVGVALICGTFGVHAAPVTVFDDDFTADSAGVAGFETRTELTNWNVTQGNIDVLGAGFGCVGCLDLDGSGSPATAVLETKAFFEYVPSRNYRFQMFFSGGTQQETVTVGFAGDSASFLAGSGPSVFDGIIGGANFGFSTITISLSGPVNNFGPYLYRVLVTYDDIAEPTPIPLPAAAPMLFVALGALGVIGARRRLPT